MFAGSFDEYLAWVVPGSPATPVTQHVLGQTVIEYSGATALAETHVTAYYRLATDEGHRDTVIGGRYLDTMDGPSVDWSHGVMGMPLRDHYHGKAVGDYSEAFFAK
jgi:SnoaL-like domain